MAKARQTLSRLAAIKNIRTVTTAMETVASSQFKRAHNRAVAVRPYTDKLTDMVVDIIRRGQIDHPLLHDHCDERKEVLLILTSSRGLCGGYNGAILRMAMERLGQLIAAEDRVLLHAAGKKGIAFLTYRNIEIERKYTELGSPPSWEDSARLADELMGDFLSGRISGFEVAYTQFMSGSRQKPAIAQILPVTDLDPSAGLDGPQEDDWDLPPVTDFVPSAEEIVSDILPAMVRLKLYQCFLDAAVSEQISRVFAMRGANDNADDMIRALTRRYNRLRQGQITTELTEILGGRMEFN